MLIKKLLVGLALTTIAFASQAAEDSGKSSEAAKIEQMEHPKHPLFLGLLQDW